MAEIRYNEYGEPYYYEDDGLVYTKDGFVDRYASGLYDNSFGYW